jgi:peptidoglycan/LPS O-acetylase OafA/YrhL
MKQYMVNNRDYKIDIVRALCALEIIAFWHMMDYLPEKYALTGQALHLAKLLTNTALATFAFISGFCLSKYTFTKSGDVWHFYKKRLIRFYPLLLFSALSLLVAGYVFHHPWFTSTSQFVTTITGLNVFIPPLAMTLWYFSMIMFFYIITPLVLSRGSILAKLLIALSLLAIVFVVDLLFLDVDNVFYLYYPFYALGLILPSSSLEFIYRRKYLFLPISVALFTATVLITSDKSDYFMGGGIYVAMISGLVMLFAAATVINSLSKGLTKFFFGISFSSMVAYLFHRQIYFVIIYAIGDSNQELSIVKALFVAVPIIFAVSFLVQKAYDFLIEKCKLK